MPIEMEASAEDAPPSMLLPSVDGCPLAVWRRGRAGGRAVVLLHGFALDHSVWDGVTALPALAERCDLVLPDLRGHGRSGRPPDRAGYVDGHRWAGDLQALIEACGLVKPVVVAWSYSGRMLNDYLRHVGPSGLGGIVYVAAATLADAASVGPAHACLAALCSDDPAVEREAASRFIGEVLGLPPGSAAFRHHERVLARTQPAQRAWLRERPLDYDELLSTLDLPVLACHGGRDQVVLPRLAQRLAQTLPRATARVDPDAGHAPFLEHPGRFADDLLNFIATLDPPDRARAAGGSPD